MLYSALGLVAFNRVHPFFTSPSEIFQAPYASTIETLLDGNHTAKQLVDGTPAQLSELLTPRGFALMRHPTGGLATALRIDSSSCNWTPRVPTRLYYATGDEQAVNANAFTARRPSPPTARRSPRSTSALPTSRARATAVRVSRAPRRSSAGSASWLTEGTPMGGLSCRYPR